MDTPTGIPSLAGRIRPDGFPPLQISAISHSTPNPILGGLIASYRLEFTGWVSLVVRRGAPGKICLPSGELITAAGGGTVPGTRLQESLTSLRNGQIPFHKVSQSITCIQRCRYSCLNRNEWLSQAAWDKEMAIIIQPRIQSSRLLGMHEKCTFRILPC